MKHKTKVIWSIKQDGQHGHLSGPGNNVLVAVEHTVQLHITVYDMKQYDILVNVEATQEA